MLEENINIQNQTTNDKLSAQPGSDEKISWKQGGVRRKAIIASVALIAILVPVTIFVAIQKNTVTDKSSASSQEIPSVEDARQGIDDAYYAGIERSFMSKHPWYNSIPKGNKDFFIGFDPETDEFFVDIYAGGGTSVQTQSQTDSEKQSVVNILKSIGVDTNKYRASWNATSTRPEL